LQLTDIDSLKVLANGVLRSSAHIEIIWQNEACSKDLCVLSWRVFNGLVLILTCDQPLIARHQQARRMRRWSD
jgi:hypothetical protein